MDGSEHGSLSGPSLPLVLAVLIVSEAPSPEEGGRPSVRGLFRGGVEAGSLDGSPDVRAQADGVETIRWGEREDGRRHKGWRGCRGLKKQDKTTHESLRNGSFRRRRYEGKQEDASTLEWNGGQSSIASSRLLPRRTARTAIREQTKPLGYARESSDLFVDAICEEMESSSTDVKEAAPFLGVSSTTKRNELFVSAAAMGVICGRTDARFIAPTTGTKFNYPR